MFETTNKFYYFSQIINWSSAYILDIIFNSYARREIDIVYITKKHYGFKYECWQPVYPFPIFRMLQW